MVWGLLAVGSFLSGFEAVVDCKEGRGLPGGWLEALFFDSDLACKDSPKSFLGKPGDSSSLSSVEEIVSALLGDCGEVGVDFGWFSEAAMFCFRFAEVGSPSTAFSNSV